ncbi:hypothetical protein D3C79_735910 [compost metagenome]
MALPVAGSTAIPMVQSRRLTSRGWKSSNQASLKIRSSSESGWFIHSVNQSAPSWRRFISSSASGQRAGHSDSPAGVMAANRRPIQLASTPSLISPSRRLGRSSGCMMVLATIVSAPWPRFRMTRLNQM